MEQASSVAQIVGYVIALLLIASFTHSVSKRIKLPFSIALVMAGIGLAWAANSHAQLAVHLPDRAILPGLIMFVFLPTLVFESAFNMETRLLNENLGPVLTLAILGLLVSTFLIGIIVAAATPIPFIYALLIGSILSATDPVAVIALFRQLGAPRRLTVLVEGESLFNDATAIVASRILIGVIAAGTFTYETVIHGVVEFFVVFVGGMLVGWILGLITGYILGMVESDNFLEITLTTILAYLSFILAEQALHVSGIMATVAAGLTMAFWGRMKVSPSVRRYLDHFWEYMAFLANALIFLLVGMHVNLYSLLSTLDMLVWIIAAMLFSRAAIIYALIPLVGRISKADKIDLRYQTVMFWGGLRGAIALAIVLSLENMEMADTLIALVTGAVLFTLFAQGLSMNQLVKRLGLNKPSLDDQFARLEGGLASKQRALDRIPELMAGGQFSETISAGLREKCEVEISRLKEQMEGLHGVEMDVDVERRLLFLLGFAEEKSLFIDMYNKGHLSERALHELTLVLDLQADGIRHGQESLSVSYHRLKRRRIEKFFQSVLDRIPVLDTIGDTLHKARIVHDYEVAWGRYQGSGRVMKELGNIAKTRTLSEQSIDSVASEYLLWNASSRRFLDQNAEQFPEFVSAMQQRLGMRLMRLAEAEVIEEMTAHGVLPKGVSEKMLGEISMELIALRGLEIGKLETDPSELLRKVPFFSDALEEDFSKLAAHMRPRTFATKEVIIRQGDTSATLFLIARGVVRVTRKDAAGERDIATMIAGDFFGEIALLGGGPRQATVWAVTPCSLYELSRDSLNEAMEKHPEIRLALEEAKRFRQTGLDNG